MRLQASLDFFRVVDSKQDEEGKVLVLPNLKRSVDKIRFGQYLPCQIPTKIKFRAHIWPDCRVCDTRNAKLNTANGFRKKISILQRNFSELV